MKKVNIGFIGAGRINVSHAAKHLVHYPEVKLVGCADISDKAAKAMAEQFNMKYFTDYEKLLQMDDLDAVWIATPPMVREGPVIAAAEAGKDIFCEKPLGASLNEADKMVEAVKKAGVKFQIGTMKRHAPRFRKVKELIENGDLGEPYYCFSWYIGNAEIWGGVGWWWNINISGGLLIENTNHYIDMTRYLLPGKVTKIYANLDQLYANRPVDSEFFSKTLNVKPTVEDSGAIIFHFDRPQIGLVACGMMAPVCRKAFPVSHSTFPNEETRLIGTEGGVVARSTLNILPSGFSEESDLTFYSRKEPDTKSWRYLSAGYEEQFDYFIRKVLLGDSEPNPTIYEGRETLEAVIASLLSAKTGQPVKVPLEKRISIQDLMPLPWQQK